MRISDWSSDVCSSDLITDADIARLSSELTIPLNLEMAATDEMLGIALRHRPHAACIVPEKREELTTEGGLDAAGLFDRLQPLVAALAGAGVRVSLFIEPASRRTEPALTSGRAQCGGVGCRCE